MKKIALVFVLFLGMNSLFGQAQSQLNFGLIGVSYDIPLGTDFSIAPFARTDFNMNWLAAGAKFDYYFDNLMGIPKEWDFYGGAHVGYASLIVDEAKYGKDFSSMYWGLEIGGRYFWSEKWGINVEAQGGYGFGGMIGLTMRL